MKQGKKPTRNQKIAMEANGLNSNEWLVVKVFPQKILIIKRGTNETKEISIN